MKIAVLGKKNYLYWDNHVSDAFQYLGHTVKSFQINSRPFAIQTLRGLIKPFNKKKAQQLSDVMHAKRIVKELNSFKPDLIFITSAFFVSCEYYMHLKEVISRPLIYAWDGDGGVDCAVNSHYVDFIDIMFESEYYYTIQNKLSFKNIIHLPFAANPNVHTQLNLKRKNAIYFCGAWSLERDAVITSINYPLTLKGWNWKRLSKKQNFYSIEEGTVNMTRQVKDYNSHIAVLNKHQAVNHIDALNMRTFEVPACGALLINDFRKELPYMYDIDKEICVYRNIEELSEIIGRLETSPKDFEQIIISGFKRTLNEHTYLHRMQKVLTYV
ncbi:glycosyltransferase [Sulfurospirillum sp. UCH001]|uniref:CgeB family protein n=1 Tax=Sulfurospirillum sp. UCH001 TaxID=1581011 RepID=UPI00083642F1|nr:glycosyltransferase [Sulfurospirillum sp. UCH001]